MNENIPFNDTYNSLNQAASKAAAQNIRPQITAQMPGEWFSKENITILAPDGQANVMASSEPLSLDVDAARYAEVQCEMLRCEFPGYKELFFDSALIFGNRIGYVHHFQWTPPDGVSVTQMQIYYTENSRGYTATATTRTVFFERYKQQLQEILDSLRIGQT
jgi:hypothetical protein